MVPRERRVCLADAGIHALEVFVLHMDNVVEDLRQNSCGRAHCVDFDHGVFGVVLKDRVRLALVDLEAALDHFVLGVVGAILFKSALLHALEKLNFVSTYKMDDFEYVNVAIKKTGLLDAAGQAIKNEKVLGRLKEAEDGVGVNVLMPDANGDVVGHELATRGVLIEDLAKLGGDIEVAEDLAGG